MTICEDGTNLLNCLIETVIESSKMPSGRIVNLVDHLEIGEEVYFMKNSKDFDPHSFANKVINFEKPSVLKYNNQTFTMKLNNIKSSLVYLISSKKDRYEIMPIQPLGVITVAKVCKQENNQVSLQAIKPEKVSENVVIDLSEENEVIDLSQENVEEENLERSLKEKSIKHEQDNKVTSSHKQKSNEISSSNLECDFPDVPRKMETLTDNFNEECTEVSKTPILGNTIEVSPGGTATFVEAQNVEKMEIGHSNEDDRHQIVKTSNKITSQIDDSHHEKSLKQEDDERVSSSEINCVFSNVPEKNLFKNFDKEYVEVMKILENRLQFSLGNSRFVETQRVETMGIQGLYTNLYEDNDCQIAKKTNNERNQINKSHHESEHIKNMEVGVEQYDETVTQSKRRKKRMSHSNADTEINAFEASLSEIDSAVPDNYSQMVKKTNKKRNQITENINNTEEGVEQNDEIETKSKKGKKKKSHGNADKEITVFKAALSEVDSVTSDIFADGNKKPKKKKKSKKNDGVNESDVSKASLPHEEEYRLPKNKEKTRKKHKLIEEDSSKKQAFLNDADDDDSSVYSRKSKKSKRKEAHEVDRVSDIFEESLPEIEGVLTDLFSDGSKKSKRKKKSQQDLIEIENNPSMSQCSTEFEDARLKKKTRGHKKDNFENSLETSHGDSKKGRKRKRKNDDTTVLDSTFEDNLNISKKEKRRIKLSKLESDISKVLESILPELNFDEQSSKKVKKKKKTMANSTMVNPILDLTFEEDESYLSYENDWNNHYSTLSNDSFKKIKNKHSDEDIHCKKKRKSGSLF